MTQEHINPETYKETGTVIKKVTGAHGTFWIGKNAKGEESHSQYIEEVAMDLA